MKYIDKAKDYFERHPNSAECHITADGRVFHDKGSADGFAGTLDDNAVETYSRKAFMAEQKAFADENAKKLRAEEDAKFVAADLEATEYADLKNFAKFYELETADQKAETLKAALVELQIKLKNA